VVYLLDGVKFDDKKKKPKERNSGLKRVAAPAPSSYCGQINGGDTRCFDLDHDFPT
jgi:hypothetical protein